MLKINDLKGLISKAKDEVHTRYRALERKHTHRAVFAQKIAQNAAVVGWKGVHRLLYGNPLESIERVQVFLRHPMENLRRTVTRAEIRALSELWELSWTPSTYSEPRKVYTVKRMD